MLRFLGVGLVAVMAAGLVGACGSGADTGVGVVVTADGPAGSDGTSAATDTTGGPTGTDTAPTVTGGSGTTGPASGSATGDGDLPGDPFDYGPAAGQQLAVVGVRYDDELNLRARPDPGAAVVATAAPLAAAPEIRSAGDGRLLASSAWWRVTVDGTEAWANVAFLGALGAPREVLAELNEAGVSDGADAEALVAALLEARGSEDVTTTATLAAAPTATSLTVDLLGYADDAVRGERFILTLAPAGSGVTLTAAQAIPICSRGASAGLCL